MSLDTYANLVTAISNWLGRVPGDSNDPVNVQIPDFIKLTEADLARRLRSWVNTRQAVALYNEAEETLPDDVASLISVFTKATEGNYQRLSYLAPDEFYHIDRTAGTAEHYYTLINRKIIISGRRAYDATETDELHINYYSKPLGLNTTYTDDEEQVITVTSNDILTYYPDLYLYGSLMHSQSYMGGDQRLPVWQQMYETALEEANQSAGERSTVNTVQSGIGWAP